MNTAHSYSISQVSALTKLNPRSLRRYIKSGELRGEKKGNVWSFAFEEVVRFFMQPETFETLKRKHAARVKKYIFEKGMLEDGTLITFKLSTCETTLLREIIESVFDFEKRYVIEILFLIREKTPLVICYGGSKNVKKALAAFREKPHLKEELERMREATK